MSVIGAVEPTLRKAEVERARRKRPDNLDAYDLFLRALPFAATAMPENADKALRLLEEAIRLEPDYRGRRMASSPGAMSSVICVGDCTPKRGRRLADMLMRQSRPAATMRWRWRWEALSSASWSGTIETALDALDRSFALSPSSALAFGFSSIIRAWMGDYCHRD